MIINNSTQVPAGSQVKIEKNTSDNIKDKVVTSGDADSKMEQMDQLKKFHSESVKTTVVGSGCGGGTKPPAGHYVSVGCGGGQTFVPDPPKPQPKPPSHVSSGC